MPILTTEFNAVPPPAGSQLLGDVVLKRIHSIVLRRSYRGDIPFGDVSHYYVEELRKNGWMLMSDNKFNGGRELRLCKAPYAIVLASTGQAEGAASVYRYSASWPACSEKLP
jgi:hypothetical protein